MAKSLVVYFSRRGQNYWNGSIKELAKGNTETVAEMIAAAVDGDLFEVERTEPYPENYDACTHEGSGLGKSEKDMRTACAGAEVLKGLAVKGSQAAESAASVTSWAKAALV